jgi:hypothetical protein
MKSMTVLSMDCISALTQSTWAQHDTLWRGNWCPALPEPQCLSKTMIAYLESFLAVQPFRQTQDPCVNARIDILYREAMP